MLEQNEHWSAYLCRLWQMHMSYLAVSATFFALVALASTSPLAADCGAGADEANAK